MFFHPIRVAAVLLFCSTGIQAADQAVSTIATGLFYSQGQSQETGQSDTRSVAVPLIISTQYQRFYTAISSYAAQLSSDNLTNSTVENSPGLGDLTLALGYNVSRDARWRVQVKQKLATGDTDKGLSTGENDTALQLDFFDSIDHEHFLFYTLGYKWVGKVSGLNMRNPLYSTIGLGQFVTPSSAVSLSLDYFQSQYRDLEDAVSLSLSTNHIFNPTWALSGFGSYDSSDTFGIGISIVRSF